MSSALFFRNSSLDKNNHGHIVLTGFDALEPFSLTTSKYEIENFINRAHIISYCVTNCHKNLESGSYKKETSRKCHSKIHPWNEVT